MIDSFFSMLKDVFWWIASVLSNFVSDTLSAFLDVAAEAVPEDLADGIDAYLPYFEVANQWVPLDLGLTYFAAYWTYSFSVWALRFLIGLIRGM